MPNQITTTGLEVKTTSEIIADIVLGLQAIYGNDINTAQNTPDGQLINIFAQAVTDLLELLVDIYNTFSVELAYGVMLDQRLALNGIARRAGTFTLTDVDISVDRALTLPGLDTAIDDPDGIGFTVADDAGNQFILAATQIIAAAGSYTFSFRAKAIGAVETTPNTITNQITVTLGVTNVNNPSAATSIGENEETDAELKIRHAQSFSLAATGPADSVAAALLSLSGVTSVFVGENDTGGTVDMIPSHSIWCVVEGGLDADIAQAIYAKKAPGCGMKGSVTVDISRPAGNTFTAKFDRPIDEDLYIKFTLVPRRAGITFDTDLIKTQLVAALTYDINQSANIGDVVVSLLTIAPDGVLTDIGVSDDGMSYVDILAPTTFQYKFVLATTRIDITV